MNNEKQIIDSVLKLYWTPKNTHLWSPMNSGRFTKSD